MCVRHERAVHVGGVGGGALGEPWGSEGRLPIAFWCSNENGRALLVIDRR
jgi:hypothetical protein